VGVFAGLCTLDVVQEVEHLPRPDEKITAWRQVVAAGGPATNAAVTFAALGGRAVLVTALGTGAVADIARTDLTLHGVEIVDVAPNEPDRLSVSSVLVRVGAGERAVVSTDAGSQPVEEVLDLRAVLGAADVVLVDGHHAVLMSQIAQWAHTAAIPVVLDAGRWRPAMAGVLSAASTVICSADFRHPGSTDVESSARLLRGAGVPIVIVTQGAEPALWWAAGRSGSVVPPRVEPVDTSGAGDAFHGAYCFYAANGTSDVERLLERAARVASTKCAHFGPRSWLQQLDVSLSESARPPTA
jgi:sugar/nucleoside kinase (ribokinase family)